MIWLRAALCVLLPICFAGRMHCATACDALPARNRSDIAALANAGIEFSRRQHYQEAAGCYRKALSIEPTIPEIQLNLGLAEFKLGDFQAALGPLAATLAVDSGNIQARTLLGMSYYGAGLYSKALPNWTARLPPIPTTPNCIMSSRKVVSGPASTIGR